MKKFVRLYNDGTIRLVGSESNITNPSKYKLCIQKIAAIFIKLNVDRLVDAQALFIGKVTRTLNKSSNQQLEFARCFSIIFPERTLDFHCSPTQTIKWVLALAFEIKRNNVNSIVKKSSKYLWRWLYFKMVDFLITKDEYFIEHFPKTFCKAVADYARFYKDFTENMSFIQKPMN